MCPDTESQSVFRLPFLFAGGFQRLVCIFRNPYHFTAASVIALRMLRFFQGRKIVVEMKKKILFITNHSYMFFRFRKELLEAFLTEYDVLVSTPFVGHEKDLEALGCTMIETTVNRRKVNLLAELKLLLFYFRLILREKPEMVITYSIKPNVYAGIACRILNVPYCLNVQGLGTAFQKKGLAQIAALLYRLASKKARTVFFENTESAQIFRDKKITPAAKQIVLPGAGINLEHYAYTPYPHNDTTHFLYLGRFMKEKGMDELLYAAKRLHEIYGNRVVLDLVGFFEDEYAQQINQLIEEGCVVFHGFQEDPQPYYAKADCVVLPSHHEGLSNVLLEAAAMGRPVITNDIPGCRETVVRDKSGFLCPPKDREKLLEAMDAFMRLSREEREQMGKCAREYMRGFDKALVVEQTVSSIFSRETT